MGFKTEELEQKVIEVIRKQKIVFFDDIDAYMPCSRGTLYNHGLHQLDTIKKEIETNRIKLRKKLRTKMEDSDNPTMLVALYKLVCTEDEHARLSKQGIDITSKGDKIENSTIIQVMESDHAKRLSEIEDKLKAREG